MKSESEMDEEAPVEGASRAAKWRQGLLSAGLRVIDALSGLLSRARGKFEVEPSGEDRSGESGGKSHPDHSAAAPQSAASAKPRRLVQLLIFLLVLMIGAAAGGAFSYRLLSKTISSDSVTIEKLRDEIAEMKKQELREQKQITQEQQMIRDYDQTIVGYLKELDESRAQVEELRGQLSASKAVRGDSANQNRRSSPPVTAAGKAAPLKTGICTMDTAKDAASLANCIEQFNRK